MTPSWSDLLTTQTIKTGNASHLSKPGKGANAKQVRQQKRLDQISTKVAMKKNAAQDIRSQKQAGEIWLCPLKNSDGAFCKHQFLELKGWNDHIAKGKYAFPVRGNPMDAFLMDASKQGGLVAFGGRPNRQGKLLFYDIVEAAEESVGEKQARSLWTFNRSDKNIVHPKPPTSVEFLRKCFDAESKMTGQNMHDLMKLQIDPEDGGLKFCRAKAMTNGIVLSFEQINSWI
jgi:hypothetical protein